MDPDLNKYDLEHIVTAHPNMSRKAWEDIYLEAWKLYYTHAHMEAILKRARAKGINIYRLMLIVLWFSCSVSVEGVHPLQGGILRLKSRHERRPELPRASLLTFYPWLAWEFVSKQTRLLIQAARLYWMCKRVSSAKGGMSYMDTALTPVSEDELETLEIFSQNKAARDAVAHARKIKGLTASAT